MEGEYFDVVSWKIENFSCWNQTSELTSPKVIFDDWDIQIKLYPKDSVRINNLWVLLSIRSQKEGMEEIFGDLMFIGSDESKLYVKEIYHVEGEYFDLGISTELSFKEVIDKIRENESDHKDQLTLRLMVKSDRYREYYICTTIEIFEVTLEVDLFKTGDFKVSTIGFNDGDHNKEMDLKTRWIDEDKKLLLYLDVGSCCIFPYSVQTHLSLLNSGSLVRYENNEHVFRVKEPWLFSDSLSEKELQETSNSLILRLKIISGKESHTRQYVDFVSYNARVQIVSDLYVSIQKAKSYQESPKGVLLTELNCLYEGRDFSDMQIKCGNDTFPVHKNILSARSPVLKTMLLTDMKESASGIVDIVDLDTQTLSQFLRFLYTGELGEKLEGDRAIQLYYAADKYQVPSLKRESARFLAANVSNSNVCDVLLLGEKYKDEKILFAAHKFILRNYNDFLKSDNWRSFMKSEPELALETLTNFAEKGYVGNLNAL